MLVLFMCLVLPQIAHWWNEVVYDMWVLSSLLTGFCLELAPKCRIKLCACQRKWSSSQVPGSVWCVLSWVFIKHAWLGCVFCNPVSLRLVAGTWSKSLSKTLSCSPRTENPGLYFVQFFKLKLIFDQSNAEKTVLIWPIQGLHTGYQS